MFLAACAEGDLEEVRSILSFSPSILDTLIALKTPTLESAGPEFADKTPTDIVRDLGTPSHQGIQEIFEQETKAMENVNLIHLAAKSGSVHTLVNLLQWGSHLTKFPNTEKMSSQPLCV